MTEEEKNDDTRDPQPNPFAQKLADLCDALGVDPESGGWLDGCLEEVKRIAQSEEEGGREMNAANDEIFRLSEKLKASEKKRVDLDALFGQSQLKLKQAEARVVELDQDLRKEREKIDSMRDRKTDPKVLDNLVVLAVANWRRADALIEAVKKLGGDPAKYGHPRLEEEEGCDICHKPKSECTCQNEVEVETEPYGERGLDTLEPEAVAILKGNSEPYRQKMEAKAKRDREIQERARELSEGPAPSLKEEKLSDEEKRELVRKTVDELEERHKTKVGQYESTHLDPIEEAKRAAKRLDSKQKENRQRLGAMETTVAQGVHDFAQRLQSLQPASPLDAVADELKGAMSRAQARAEESAELPEWTDVEDLELRKKLVMLEPLSGWSGKGPRADVVAIHPVDNGEAEIEYQLHDEIHNMGNNLAPRRMLPIRTFIEKFPDCVQRAREHREGQW